MAEIIEWVWWGLTIALAFGGGAFLGGLKGFALGTRIGAMGRKSAGGWMGLAATFLDTPEVKSAVGGFIKDLLAGFSGKKERK